MSSKKLIKAQSEKPGFWLSSEDEINIILLETPVSIYDIKGAQQDVRPYKIELN